MSKFHPFRSLTREFHHIVNGASVVHIDLRDRLLTAFTLTVLVDIILTILIYKFEAGQKGSSISNLWDAFFFTTSQLTTIGSPMNNPVTTTGEVLVLMLNFYTATVVTTIAGVFGAYFYHLTDQRRKDTEKKP